MTSYPYQDLEEVQEKSCYSKPDYLNTDYLKRYFQHRSDTVEILESRLSTFIANTSINHDVKLSPSNRLSLKEFEIKRHLISQNMQDNYPGVLNLAIELCEQLSTENLQTLSTLLKINDLLISCINVFQHQCELLSLQDCIQKETSLVADLQHE